MQLLSAWNTVVISRVPVDASCTQLMALMMLAVHSSDTVASLLAMFILQQSLVVVF